MLKKLILVGLVIMSSSAFSEDFNNGYAQDAQLNIQRQMLAQQEEQTRIMEQASREQQQAIIRQRNNRGY